ncbi:tyrosine--tRNA ligase chloroplastic/mitochondrial [Prunus yedoensis var. nudiflora]|uniref:Tyrosine--tRNA ligase n=1 Tax=Prunus yedoensis var. nudiflora TaxID=2094558 RepID=A0A315A844_PRUYE|nr:tyrosine--tRNA ligase chloroplastic/mitochondrial [Prunus yedoensis var. nudiflora]
MAAVATSRAFLFSHHYHSLPFFFPSFLTASRLPTLHRNNLRNPILLSTVKCLQSSSGRQNVVEILEERGLLESLTSEHLRQACSDPSLPPLKVYCGFDPTAESLHLGNLLGIIVLSWFQRCGHRPVALIGGATARVGDPSGKSLERPELDLDTLSLNTSGVSNNITRILGRISILNNYEWWKEVRLLEFLKDVGRYARVGSMIAKESGYDFLYLFQNEGINVQIGGSDQWGNITAGTELIRKILRADAAAYGLTFPLLLKSDGTKFGKSEDGAIWLSPSMLSPYKFYQYLFSVPDADVVRFLRILTFMDMDEIKQLENEMEGPGYLPNTAQRRLAEEVTRFVHGQDGLDEALKATEALRPGADTKLDWKTIQAISEDVPSCSFPYNQRSWISLLLIFQCRLVCLTANLLPGVC